TKTMRGRYAYLVKVNYDNYGKSIIPERSMVNNSILRYFYVVEDKINPLLDVTFDGKHIGNGEIVSSNPTIYISSKDENTLNWQTDTNGIKIWLKKPNSSTFERIDFNTSDVKFYPATSSYNLAKAEFKPGKLTDGIYTLKVQSNDANGTNSGVTEYMINFTVINQASATNFYPYPNPCTNAMRFVFTLTGTEVPDYINIKIMTIQGKVVKELNREDLGDIHIGNNITDIVWDGTDEFGDRLSNGVYLYTVTIKINGQEVTQIQSESISSDLNADKANNDMFKHSIGKIVLLR
ncbi:MAG TPA: transporter, partial [Bacteroidia bacterium]